MIKRRKEVLSIPQLKEAINGKVADLRNRGLLPNGIYFLVVGSSYRRDSLFTDLVVAKKLKRNTHAYSEAWDTFTKEYDLYGGENLAKTALYQHKRYTPEDKRFPKEGTTKFTKFIKEMESFGNLLRDLSIVLNEKSFKEFLSSL